MRFFYFLFPCLITLLSGSVFASADKDFRKASEALARGQQTQFEQHASRIPQDHPFAPYIAYWRLQGRKENSSWLDFADKYPDTPLSQRAREVLIRRHIQSGDWQAALIQAKLLHTPSEEMGCLVQTAQWELVQRRRPLQLEASFPGISSNKMRDSACESLYRSLREAGVIDDVTLLYRIRLALENGQPELVRTLNAMLAADQRMDAHALAQSGSQAESLIREHSPAAAQREAALFALNHLARKDPAAAASLWAQEGPHYSTSERSHGWGVIAVAAAREHHPTAPNWFRYAGTSLTPLQHTWHVRANLRAGHWQEVYHGIMTMPPALQNEPVWRYWRARALQVLNARAAAHSLFAELAHGFDYYALLAGEELGERLQGVVQAEPLTDSELKAAESHPGLTRALLLRKLGFDAEARGEWGWAMRGMDDRALMGAAERARRAAWYDRAILTATQTRDTHSLDLRYITPYRDLAESYAKERDLDVAWVYGLMRQESRFVDYARSRVGAGGLMQIMPGTASWIARQIGSGRKVAKQMHEPDHNVRFGTWYLRHLYDGLDKSPVLATAAYNAGPGRSRKWQADRALEGAIYVETIPFLETRDYVKKVLSNAMFYTQRMGLSPIALKARLGYIAPRSAQPLPEDEKVPWIAPQAPPPSE